MFNNVSSQKVIKLLITYIYNHGVSISILLDQANGLTCESFAEFCQEAIIEVIYVPANDHRALNCRTPNSDRKKLLSRVKVHLKTKFCHQHAGHAFFSEIPNNQPKDYTYDSVEVVIRQYLILSKEVRNCLVLIRKKLL